MLLKNKRVLVTGAGGFIGSHLVEALCKKGANVRAFVKYNGRSDSGMLSDLQANVVKSIEVIFGNICDPFFVRKVVAGCDCVFHLAALIGIPYSYVAAHDYVAVNVQGTINVLEACRDEGTPRMVHTSTSEAYGTALYVPIDEKHPLQAQSPYSASKIAADKMAESYHKSFDLPVVTVRPFNTFGPRQSARAFIPTVISQVLTNEKLTIGSLEPVRDMTFVKDTTEGLIAVGLTDKAIGRVVNLGVGHGAAIGDIAKTILALMNRQDMPIEEDPRRIRPAKSEVMRLVSNNALAKELCAWKPKYSLEEGLSETIKWVEQNIKAFRTSAYSI